MPMQISRQWLFASLQRACRPSLTGLRVQGVSCQLSLSDPASNLMTKRSLGTADLGGGRTPVGSISCGAVFSLTGLEVNTQIHALILHLRHIILLQPSCRALPLVSCAWVAMLDQVLHCVSTPRSASTCPVKVEPTAASSTQ